MFWILLIALIAYIVHMNWSWIKCQVIFLYIDSLSNDTYLKYYGLLSEWKVNKPLAIIIWCLGSTHDKEVLLIKSAIEDSFRRRFYNK